MKHPVKRGKSSVDVNKDSDKINCSVDCMIIMRHEDYPIINIHIIPIINMYVNYWVINMSNNE